MKLGQAIKQAVTGQDAHAAGRIVDVLRFNHRFNYDGVYGMFHRLTGISKGDFEALMYEADQHSEV